MHVKTYSNNIYVQSRYTHHCKLNFHGLLKKENKNSNINISITNLFLKNFKIFNILSSQYVEHAATNMFCLDK